MASRNDNPTLRAMIAGVAPLVEFLVEWQTRGPEIDAMLEAEAASEQTLAADTAGQHAGTAGVHALVPHCTLREAARRKQVSLRSVQEALARGELEEVSGAGERRVTLRSVMRWQPQPPAPALSPGWTGALAASTGGRAQVWVTRQTRHGHVLLVGDPQLLADQTATADAVVAVPLPTGGTAAGRVRYIADDIVVIQLEPR